MSVTCQMMFLKKIGVRVETVNARKTSFIHILLVCTKRITKVQSLCCADADGPSSAWCGTGEEESMSMLWIRTGAWAEPPQ